MAKNLFDLSARLFIVLFVLLTGCETKPHRAPVTSIRQSPQLFDSTVFVIFDIGQSNSIGRATSARLTDILHEPSQPEDVLIYYKPDYSDADNGKFEPLIEGSANTTEPDATTRGISGAYGMIASRIASVSSNPVYVIAAGDGGTALKKNASNPDWDEDTDNECFDVAVNRYYKVAYPKIVAAHPGKVVRTIICWHQGETDALTDEATADYGDHFPEFIETLRASHPSLNESLLIITKIHFKVSPNEAAINDVFQKYADANPVQVRVVDISQYPRKMDLTDEQKGGVTTARNDDEHTSYIGMQAKAIQSYRHIHDVYFPFVKEVSTDTTTLR